MQSSGSCPAAYLRVRFGIGRPYFGTRNEAQLTVDDNRFAGGNSFADYRHALLCRQDVDIAQLGAAVGLDDIKERSVRTLLHRLRRYRDDLLQHLEGQRDADKLARRQLLAFIGEHCLHLDGAGGRIDGVVEKLDLAGQGGCGARQTDSRGNSLGAFGNDGA